MGNEPRIRRFYDREPVLATIGSVSMTQQHMKDECDINNIMAKYQKTGLITHVAAHRGNYDDFTIMPDYKTAMDTMMSAQEMFLTIPSEIRAHFENDAGQFVEFATDPDNYDQMVDMGLVPLENQYKREERQTKKSDFKKRKKAAKAASNDPDKVSSPPSKTQPDGEKAQSSS